MPNIEIDSDLWRRVKIAAATEGQPAKRVVTVALENWLTTSSSTLTSSVQGSEVRFATNTPPLEDRTDLTPKAIKK